jgi:FkbM family methyltransferase
VRTLLAVLRLVVPAPARRALGRTRLGGALARATGEDAAYEPELRRALEAIVQPGWVCADVGAHHGIITRLLARLVGPSGRVIAFEAHPGNAEELARTVTAAGVGGRIRVENLAVTDGAAPRVALHPGRGHASTEWNVTGADVEGHPTPAELQVAATSLDTYFGLETRLELVKIDVEGAEGQVLAGMRRVLREARPVLVVEFHDEAGWEGRRELLEAGYDLYAVDGTRLEPRRDLEREYHCLALPSERPLSARPL